MIKLIPKFFFCLLLFSLAVVKAQNIPSPLPDENNFYAEGKVIYDIRIKVYNVADPSVFESNGNEAGWFGKIVNSLHYKTRDWVVRERLLFKQGDIVDSKKISESERLLRNSTIFQDARIKIVPVPGRPENADVEVIVQDRWTLTYLAAYNSHKEYGYLGLKDENLLGFGHLASAAVTFNQDSLTGWGGEINYKASNLFGTFIDAGTNLEFNRKYDLKELFAERPFVTLETGVAGGIQFAWESNSLNYINSSGDFFSIPFSHNRQDLWTAVSFPVPFQNNFLKENSRMVTGFRIQRKNFGERPDLNIYNRIFENNTIYLLNLGLITRRFYKDRYIEGFGITEDVALGGALVLNGGIEERELNNRWYLSLESVYSARLSMAGYFSAKAGIGGFRNKEKWEQNVYNINLLYHSMLHYAGDWKYRFLAHSDLLFGFNRFEGEQISLNYVRGIDDLYSAGTKRLVLNLEARIFSPFSVLGFVLGASVFSDFGLVSGKKESITKSRLYQGYGIGLITKNESIINAKFGLSAVYNPYSPPHTNARFTILFSTSIILGIRSIDISKPSVVHYNEN